MLSSSAFTKQPGWHMACREEPAPCWRLVRHRRHACCWRRSRRRRRGIRWRRWRTVGKLQAMANIILANTLSLPISACN